MEKLTKMVDEFQLSGDEKQLAVDVGIELGLTLIFNSKDPGESVRSMTEVELPEKVATSLTRAAELTEQNQIGLEAVLFGNLIKEGLHSSIMKSARALMDSRDEVKFVSSMVSAFVVGQDNMADMMDDIEAFNDRLLKAMEEGIKPKTRISRQSGDVRFSELKARTKDRDEE